MKRIIAEILGPLGAIAIVLVWLAVSGLFGGCAFAPFSDPMLEQLRGKAVLTIVTNDAEEAMEYCRRNRGLLGPAVACARIARNNEEAVQILEDFIAESRKRGTGIDGIVITPPNRTLMSHEFGLLAAEGKGYYNTMNFDALGVEQDPDDTTNRAYQHIRP
ncbi:MAG: hypothetical protein GY906_24215 [bacterium]|nr:hypothetical protein [bacterium]